MRLIRRDSDGALSLTKDLIGDDEIPPYAILSHVWQHDEVTFDDFNDGKREEKFGYRKIQFCAQQAQCDNLDYFWVDTCCIKKTDFVELQDAINSMFRWYQKAAKCYVFMYDVSPTNSVVGEELITTAHHWQASFVNSRWFTRGWTLQELLAPSEVIFYSSNGERLGDKKGLAQKIHTITGIPIGALRDTPLHKFGIEERLQWTEHRQTTRKEDKAYSLLGIFNIHMPTIYGEGEENAFKRLRDEIVRSRNVQQKENLQQVVNMTKEDQDCIKSLRVTDPRLDKKRIEETKGGLLEDAYRWILQNASFRKWLEDAGERVLWIKGDPGKGKTMLLCGIINELQKTESVAYFFCQGTDVRINKATAVLRGIIYMLVQQQPWVITHIRKKYDDAGTMAFEDVNAWVTLNDIFTEIVLDAEYKKTFIIVDALDECVEGLPQLLDFIVQHGSHIKWIISSRNWPAIEEGLCKASDKVNLSLELNVDAISKAVKIFITQNVSQLAEEKKYDNNTRNTVQEYLETNAQDTFLWVSLVVQHLRHVPRWGVLEKLETYPPGLEALFGRMMQHINESDNSDLYLQVLCTVTVVFEPVTLSELATITERLKDLVNDPTSVQEIVELCGSFLTVRDSTVYFVHQSAKDFIIAKAKKSPLPFRNTHVMIFRRSINTLSAELKRSSFNYDAPDYFPGDTRGTSLLGSLRYSLINWISHLSACAGTTPPGRLIELHDGGIVHSFFRTKFLLWLEALSHYKAISIGIRSLVLLMTILRQDLEFTIENSKLVHDAHRFIMTNRVPLEASPTQVYRSALFFAPTESIIRRTFQKQIPTWFDSKPEPTKQWSACLQTLEDQTSDVFVLALSHDSTQIASGHYGGTVRIWDTESGTCLHTCLGHRSTVNSITFSPNSTKIASGSNDRAIHIWNVSSGERAMTLNGHTAPVHLLKYSPDSRLLVSSAGDEEIRVWDAHSGECLHRFNGVKTIEFSITPWNDSVWHVSTPLTEDVRSRTFTDSEGKDSKIWHFVAVGRFEIVAFSPDSSKCVSADHRKIILWDRIPNPPQRLKTISCTGHIVSLALSSDASRLAAGIDDGDMGVWDCGTGDWIHLFKGHSGSITSIAFSHDSNLLISGSMDGTIKIWDLRYVRRDTGLIDTRNRSIESHRGKVSALAFSEDSTLLASASYDSMIKIWDTRSGLCRHDLIHKMFGVMLLAFSHQSTRLVSVCREQVIKIWDTWSGECLSTVETWNLDLLSPKDVSMPDGCRQRAGSAACARRLAAALPNVLSIGMTSSYCLYDGARECVTGFCCNGPELLSQPKQETNQHSFSLKGNWIVYKSELLLWLPSEYRPCFAIAQGNTIAIGTDAGRVWIFTFDLARLQEIASKDSL